MKTEKDFWAEESRLHNLCKAKGLDAYALVNACVDLENCQPFEGQEDYWSIAFYSMHNAVGSRLSELGIDAPTIFKDFEIKF